MKPRRLFLAAIVGMLGPQLAAAALSARQDRWTLATDDTVLTLGLDGQGKLAIFELKSSKEQHNWTAGPSPVPWMDRVEAGGKAVPLVWTFQDAQIDKAQGTKLTLRFTSATPKLELESEWWARPGPGPIRHAAHLTNQSGGPVTIGYQPTLAVRLTAPRPGVAGSGNGKLWAWSFHSDGGTPDRQGVYREEVTGKLDRALRTHPSGGMVPLVVFDLAGRQGIYVGVEWSFGDIRIKGLPGPGSPGASVEAGNVLDFRGRLDAGKTFEVPPGFIGTYAGDIDAAGNRLRKYLFRYSVPEVVRNDPGYPKVQWNAFGATGKSPGSWDPVEKKYYPLIDDIAPLGFEEVMIDVGWWKGTEPVPDPVDWPSEMKKASDYAHEHGMRFGLYWSDRADVATPEGRKLRGDRVRSLFSRQGADMWRSDSTSGPVIAPNYGSVRGFYELVDGLQREVPGFQWEDCSGGGRIKDYGAMKRCVKIFMSDTYSALDVRKAFYDGSFAFPPCQLEGHLGSTNGRYRPQGAAGMRYAFRSMSMGSPEWFIDAPNGGNGGGRWTEEEKGAVKAAVATYKARIRPLVRSADLYHVLPRPDGKTWDGIEYYDPAAAKGVVYLFKPDSATDTQAIRLKGLDPHRTYRLTFADGSNAQVDKPGATLGSTGIEVTLKGKFVSELVFFEGLDGK